MDPQISQRSHLYEETQLKGGSGQVGGQNKWTKPILCITLYEYYC